MAKVIEGLLYSESHEWVVVNGDLAIIGLCVGKGVGQYGASERGGGAFLELQIVLHLPQSGRLKDNPGGGRQ